MVNSWENHLFSPRRYKCCTRMIRTRCDNVRQRIKVSALRVIPGVGSVTLRILFEHLHLSTSLCLRFESDSPPIVTKAFRFSIAIAQVPYPPFRSLNSSTTLPPKPAAYQMLSWQLTFHNFTRRPGSISLLGDFHFSDIWHKFAITLLTLVSIPPTSMIVSLRVTTAARMVSPLLA